MFIQSPYKHIILYAIQYLSMSEPMVSSLLACHAKKKSHKNNSNKDCWEKSGRGQLETL